MIHVDTTLDADVISKRLASGEAIDVLAEQQRREQLLLEQFAPGQTAEELHDALVPRWERDRG